MNTRITAMKYHYVHPPYDFWNLQYELNNYAWHKVYKSAREFKELDKTPVDAVCFLLRAQLDCEPIRERDRTFDSR